MKRFSLILFFLLLLTMQDILLSQERAYGLPESSDYVDTFKVDLRFPAHNILEKYLHDKTFDYSPNPESAETFWDKLKNWISRTLFGLQSSETFSSFIDYLLYGLMIAAVIVIIIGVFKSEIKGFFYRADKEQKIKFAEYEEDLHKINFDELIENAVENKEYKIAVRYMFLKSLKLLSDRNLISLNLNKTNHDYQAEIKNYDVARQFSLAAIGFELAWYGDYPITENAYKHSSEVFNNLYELTKEV